MASAPPRARLFDRILPDPLLAFLSLVMLMFMAAAVVRGAPRWHEASAFVWAHLVALALVLALTPVQLLGRKGSGRHRAAGWAWALAMMVAAAVSFGIRDIRDGGLGPIHILSAWVMVQVPWLVLNARRHQVEQHRVRVRILVTFALLVAGFFTFPFGRMLGSWLLG
ncbi:MAG: hypothetical protein ACK4Z0_08455 [Sphingomonadaceae bacterium]